MPTAFGRYFYLRAFIEKKKLCESFFLFSRFRRMLRMSECAPEPAHVGDASALDVSANPSRVQQDGGELENFLRPALAGPNCEFFWCGLT